VICIYNPSSLKRRDHLRKACEPELKQRGETMSGFVRNIDAKGNRQTVDSGRAEDTQVDMFTTVFIGNPDKGNRRKAGNAQGYQLLAAE
jgi:precorrin-3B C17-methyltransferase